MSDNKHAGCGKAVDESVRKYEWSEAFNKSWNITKTVLGLIRAFSNV